jgi:N6-adenosine-specific RNA methylase IME4
MTEDAFSRLIGGPSNWRSRSPGTKSGDGNLVKYEAACRALAEAKSADEVKNIHNVARQMAAAARIAKNRTLEADAYELRVRAERTLGDMIAAQKETIGLATGGQPYQRKSTGTAAAPVDALPAPTLAEAGIDKKLSSRSQKMRAIPPAAFEEMVKEGRAEIHRTAEKRVIKTVEIAEARAAYEERADRGANVGDLVAMAEAGQRFSVIYADPPWTFKVRSDKGKQRSAERHYDTSSLEDIKALPVAPLAAENCVLLLWSTWPELPAALDVVKAWGFEYKTAAFVWVKENPSGEGIFTGMGYWTRANSEFCLLATRGSPKRVAEDVHQVIMAPVGKHSEKPEGVRMRIERLVLGPYLELFARKPVDGWTVWGNEIARADEPAEAEGATA